MNQEFTITNYLKFQKKTTAFHNHIMSVASEKLGISKPEADILCFLANNPGLNTGKDIAEYRGLSKAYISKAVELLIEKELLLAAVSKADRRYQHLSLTNSALPMADFLLQTQRDFLKVMFANISKEEERILWQIMQKAADNIQQFEEKS